jgi:hypothetical protein
MMPLPNGVSPSKEYRKAEAELQEGAQIRHFVAHAALNAVQLAGNVPAFPQDGPTTPD